MIAIISQVGAEPGKPIRPWPPSCFAMDFGPPPAKKQNLFSLHFPNFCDYLVKKIVYEIRNVTSLRGTSSLRNVDYMSRCDHACLGEHIMVREIIICSHRHQHTINVWSKFLKIM